MRRHERLSRNLYVPPARLSYRGRGVTPASVQESLKRLYFDFRRREARGLLQDAHT